MEVLSTSKGDLGLGDIKKSLSRITCKTQHNYHNILFSLVQLPQNSILQLLPNPRVIDRIYNTGNYNNYNNVSFN